MFKRLFSFFLIISVLGATLLPSLATADTLEFNPNYIISDEEMQDATSMSEVDIDAFLQSKHGAIATMKFTDEDGTERTVASLIARVATTYRINPKYLLVKLQKEQSLVTDQNPSQKQLDWATGYGICDSCSMDDPALQKHKGFVWQVDSAAGIMRWYYNHLGDTPWIKRAGQTYQIDDTIVTPNSMATGFLYTYTPHIHGNKNFWKLWNEWFMQRYPNGTLLKTAGSSSIYVIQDGKKRPITSMTVLHSRFNIQLLVVVPESELIRYETGRAVSLPNYSILRQGDSYYLIDDEIIRPFADSTVVQRLGYNPDEIVDVTAEDITDYSLGPTIAISSTLPTGQLVKMIGSGAIYYIKDGQAHPVFNEAAAKSIFPKLKIEKVGSEVLADVTLSSGLTLKDGTLAGDLDSGKVYIVEHATMRHITSEQAFNRLRYNGKNIVWLPTQAFLSYASGAPIAIPHEDIN